MTEEITFAIPADLWLTANGRYHWAAKAKRVKALRHLGLVIGRGTRLRDIGPVHVAAFIGYPRGGKADPDNAQPTVKPLIDGLVDAGVLSGDDHTRVIGPTYLRDATTRRPGVHSVRLVLTPQEVPCHDLSSWCDANRHERCPGVDNCACGCHEQERP